jgi:hypothetical protein
VVIVVLAQCDEHRDESRTNGPLPGGRYSAGGGHPDTGGTTVAVKHTGAEQDRTDHVNDESQHNGNEGIRTGSVRLPRLSAPRAPGTDPTFDELGLAALAEECKTWHHVRVVGNFWELNAVHMGRPDSWREIPVLMGSVAEAALLAGSVEVEIECLRRAIAAGPLPVQYGLAVRFFAEAQGQLLLGCGHRLANIALRVMMLANGYPWGASVGYAQPFPPNSDNRDDWIPMSDLHKYQTAATASGHPSLTALVSVVVDLWSSAEWKALEDQRAMDFHRARQESPFVVGARRTGVWKTTTPAPGVTHGSLEDDDEDPTAAEIRAWSDQLGVASRAVLVGLPPVMVSFSAALSTTMSEVTVGSFSLGD